VDTPDTILGHYHAHQLEVRIAAPILIIGVDQFRRSDLARVECFNYAACTRLEAALKALQARSVAHVFEEIPPGALARPGLGVISLACLGAAFEAKRIGGEHPLVAWCRRHFAGHIVTFSSLKSRTPNSVASRTATRSRPHQRRRPH
jgi:hypothetical protein